MKIFLDYDGTLVNLIEDWVLWINKTYQTNFSIGDVTTYDWFLDVRKDGHKRDVFSYFDNNAPYLLSSGDITRPISGSQDFVSSLQNIDEIEVSILTATHDPQLEQTKDKHITYFYGGSIPIIHEKKKEKYATCDITQKGSILIDDNPTHCLDWAKCGGIALLYTRDGDYSYSVLPKKHPSIIPVNNYNEAFEAIARLQKQYSNYHIIKTELPKDVTLPGSRSYLWQLTDRENLDEVGKMEIVVQKDLGVIKINTVKIKPSLRNQGLGKMFFRELALEEKHIVLDILYDLPVSFYESMGFEFESPDSMILDMGEYDKHRIVIPSILDIDNDLQNTNDFKTSVKSL